MQRRRCFYCLVAAGLLLLGAQAAQGEEGLLDSFEKRVSEFSLDNGMTLLVVNQPEVPAVSFVTMVKVGSVDEPSGKTGLAYSVSGSCGCNYFYPGLFYVALQTKSERTAEAIRVVKRELEKLRSEGVTQEELNQARRQFLNSLVFRFDKPEEILERKLFYAYRGMELDSFQKLIEQLKNVAVEDVNRVARDYIKLENIETVVVGREADVLEQLQSLGDVTVVR